MDPMLRRILQWTLAVLILITAALLIWNTVFILREGEAQADPAAPVFSRALLRETFSRVRIPALLTGLLILILLAFRKKDSEPRSEVRPVRSVSSSACSGSEAKVLRLCLLIMAAALILAGILNGGMEDVFIKAAHVCTECIGLG